MCNNLCLNFGWKYLTQEVLEGKDILEVGARDINGTLRYHCEKFKINSYYGIDIEEGKGVDSVLSVYDLIEDTSGVSLYDIVICTEVLEHLEDWRLAVNNMKAVLKSGGYILITTRSKGFKYHAYPHDYWRYEIKDMREIFSDFMNVILGEDSAGEPGVFVFARKPFNWEPNDLSVIELYDIRKEAQS